MKNIDAFELTANLIKCPSVTPDEGGAITLLDELLSQNGFECTRIERGGVSNLFARWGGGTATLARTSSVLGMVLILGLVS